ncbi:hypothetical protein QL285_095462 [Trifolium repens]|nr:hypothetical protein QL285_095462 [Trifolium repens]
MKLQHGSESPNDSRGKLLFRSTDFKRCFLTLLCLSRYGCDSSFKSIFLSGTPTLVVRTLLLRMLLLMYGGSPMVVESEAPSRSMVGTTKGLFFSSIELVQSGALEPSTD